MMGLSDYHTHASQVNFEASSVSVSEPLPLSLSRYLFMPQTSIGYSILALMMLDFRWLEFVLTNGYAFFRARSPLDMLF